MSTGEKLHTQTPPNFHPSNRAVQRQIFNPHHNTHTPAVPNYRFLLSPETVVNSPTGCHTFYTCHQWASRDSHVSLSDTCVSPFGQHTFNILE